MNLQLITGRMARYPDALDALLGGLSEDEACWRQDDQSWSLVEVVDHLVDEELLDFGPRLRVVLENPADPYPEIDPEASVLARRSEEHNLDRALGRFRRLRETSVSWLRTLEGAEWDRVKSDAHIGTLTAGDLLTSWVCHDALHLRQIARVLHHLSERDSGHDGSYAGGW